jgi:hypothetical protein
MEGIRAFLFEFQGMMQTWSADYDNPPSFDFFKICKSSWAVAILANCILQIMCHRRPRLAMLSIPPSRLLKNL